MNEFDLIRRYFTTPFKNSLDLSGGFDDCAVLSLPSGYQQVLSVDTMLENTHFYPDMPAADIAHRALATAASDLAAMGASPWWFTLALSLPETNEQWLHEFSQGLQSLAQILNIHLVGGDTTKGPLAITVNVAGLVPIGKALCRSGAKPGDYIAVTGKLGNSAGGLAQWFDHEPDIFLRRAYSKPEPRIQYGEILQKYASACIDVSDGLLADAGHIAHASAVEMCIDYQQLPLDHRLIQYFGKADASQKALYGGDDYELCFCFNPTLAAALDASAINYHIIGQVREGSGVTLLNTGSAVPVNVSQGYQHFNE